MKKIALSALVLAGFFSLGCLKSPEFFVKGDSGEWKIVEIKDDVDQKHKWQTVVDIIATKLDIETLDETSGYIRTSWKVGYGFRRGDKYFDVYRARATVKFEPGFKRVRIKTDALWNNIEGFDNRLLNDIYQDIQGRLGRTVK